MPQNMGYRYHHAPARVHLQFAHGVVAKVRHPDVGPVEGHAARSVARVEGRPRRGPGFLVLVPAEQGNLHWFAGARLDRAVGKREARAGGYVRTEWENILRVDNLSETILFRDYLRSVKG